MRSSLMEIVRKHQGLMWLMILLFGSGLILLIVSIVTLNPDAAVVNLGYSDIGGYQSGTWTGMIGFTVFAVVVGIAPTSFNEFIVYTSDFSFKKIIGFGNKGFRRGVEICDRVLFQELRKAQKERDERERKKKNAEGEILPNE